LAKYTAASIKSTPTLQQPILKDKAFSFLSGGAQENNKEEEISFDA
jgi:hypothetical protein